MCAVHTLVICDAYYKRLYLRNVFSVFMQIVLYSYIYIKVLYTYSVA